MMEHFREIITSKIFDMIPSKHLPFHYFFIGLDFLKELSNIDSAIEKNIKKPTKHSIGLHHFQMIIQQITAA